MRRVTLGLIACFIVLLACTRWVRVNVSPSQPIGLYSLHARPPALSRGMLVVVRVPAAQVFHGSIPLLKPVAAVAHEWVCRQGETLRIHGEDYGRIYEASDAPALPSFCWQVPADHVFLASHADRSLDSRYVGAVPVTQIIAAATPWWTW